MPQYSCNYLFTLLNQKEYFLFGSRIKLEQYYSLVFQLNLKSCQNITAFRKESLHIFNSLNYSAQVDFINQISGNKLFFIETCQTFYLKYQILSKKSTIFSFISQKLLSLNLFISIAYQSNNYQNILEWLSFCYQQYLINYLSQFFISPLQLIQSQRIFFRQSICDTSLYFYIIQLSKEQTFSTY
ncbi:hypothetical protein TTHERM_000319919 (macronuclear) [Tetrahymena thermophila SB210]|uniref:Uncharacterized protein n=1 Tax=Tetrahymena thermophila (strain SB210) TaxID=312017 RepID=W7X6Y5_TETTS|nr:hypothetical protein TTHERM_000319919 [Tetrahymena thermophila SB210]EWS75140.1 hypothetical protein TTHERM_000319919 [Tetrahymena thermophila SB210]|eukprot:XP_012652296.1 hypothetical protein TTHERM_000319919 [Tetrahymena thermophila SB210]